MKLYGPLVIAALSEDVTARRSDITTAKLERSMTSTRQQAYHLTRNDLE